MVLGATLLWVAEVIIAKKLLADLSSWTVGLTRMSVGSVVLIAWTVIRSHGDAPFTLIATSECGSW